MKFTCLPRKGARMCLRSVLLVVLTVGILAGCAGRNEPVIASSEKTTYAQDVTECNLKAREAAGMAQPGKQGVIVGMGSAAGSAVGSLAAGVDVARNVAFSGPYGFFVGLFTGFYNQDQKRKNNVTQCLRGKGYNALLTD